MLRGVNRQIIEVNNTGNRYFEKVLLFVKPEYSDASQQRLEDEAGQLLASFGRPPDVKTYRQNFKQKMIAKKRIRKIIIYFGLILSVFMGYFILRFLIN